jgi:hypothetical protein
LGPDAALEFLFWPDAALKLAVSLQAPSITEMANIAA